MVGVDGSSLAHRAFTEAFAMMQPCDKLIVYHCSNPLRYTDMVASYHPDTIMASFETQAISLGADPADLKGPTARFEFVTEEKTSPDDKIRDKICAYASFNKVDVLFIGSFGAKGQDKPGFVSTNGLERVGASAQACVEKACCTVVVLKNSQPERNGEPARFMVGIDGSDISHRGFLQGCHLAQRADSLITVTIGESDPTKRFRTPLCFRPEIIVERYNELLAEMHMGEARLEYPAAGLSLGKHMCKLAEEDENIAANYMIFGSKGLSGRRAALGSIAAYCVKHSRVGVIVVKDSSRDLRKSEALKEKGAGFGEFK